MRELYRGQLKIANRPPIQVAALHPPPYPYRESITMCCSDPPSGPLPSVRFLKVLFYALAMRGASTRPMSDGTIKVTLKLEVDQPVGPVRHRRSPTCIHPDDASGRNVTCHAWGEPAEKLLDYDVAVFCFPRASDCRETPPYMIILVNTHGRRRECVSFRSVSRNVSTHNVKISVSRHK